MDCELLVIRYSDHCLYGKALIRKIIFCMNEYSSIKKNKKNKIK